MTEQYKKWLIKNKYNIQHDLLPRVRNKYVQELEKENQELKDELRLQCDTTMEAVNKNQELREALKERIEYYEKKQDASHFHNTIYELKRLKKLLNKE